MWQLWGFVRLGHAGGRHWLRCLRWCRARSSIVQPGPLLDRSGLACYCAILFSFGFFSRCVGLSSIELERLELRLCLRSCRNGRARRRSDVGGVAQCCPVLISVPISRSRLYLSQHLQRDLGAVTRGFRRLTGSTIRLERRNANIRCCWFTFL